MTINERAARPGSTPHATLRRLEERLRELSPIVVALSGGIDSTLVLAVGRRCLGPDASAVIGVSPSLPEDDLASARTLARDMGATLREVPTFELDDPRYVANAGDRCYYCKDELFRRILEATADIPGRTVVDGTNASDAGGHRPGRRAARELGVQSPLADVGLTKDDIRALARHLGVPTWDKPEAACLASRIPVGTSVTQPMLRRVDRAEQALRAMGFEVVRVRQDGGGARVEVSPDVVARALAHRSEIVAALEALGYDRVSVDPAGYRRGGGIDGNG